METAACSVSCDEGRLMKLGPAWTLFCRKAILGGSRGQEGASLEDIWISTEQSKQT